jgi:hypothetical protein
MLMLATILVTLMLPVTLLAVLLLATGRMERARDMRIARQVAVTDAVHRELGPVVAPVVKQRLGRDWRVEIAVPFDSPAIVGRVVAITHAAMLRSDGNRRIEIVLAAQEPEARRANVRKLQPASSRAASEWEAHTWTGTTTSRAV